MRTILALALVALGACKSSNEAAPVQAATPPAPAAPAPAAPPETVAVAAKVEGKSDGPAAEEGCADHTGMQKMIPADAVATRAFDHKPNVGEKAACAVSGEKFEVAADTKVAEYKGKWYAFCCDECEPDFKKDPAKFAAQ